MDDKFEKGRKVKTSDGSVRYVFDGKLHNWEGPALIPEGNMRKREYYLYGIKFSEIEWKERCKQREGLPWYKSGAAKGTARF
jgi:hypothetical protein